MFGSDKHFWTKNSDQIDQKTSSTCNSEVTCLAQNFAPLKGYFAFSWCNKPFHKRGIKRPGLSLAISVATFFAGTCLLVGAALANPTVPNLPNALPTNGQVIAGSASISQTQTPTSAAMTVNQTTQRAVVNWD
ncbi:hypothetical protein, partial [Polynucleobacter sp. JS-Polo-80-F4]|uniref:hypothetical protein n=1 Tax=Polynucleobacter sp. JS-Polo-80-F4 TaxID=2576918 RepID=UPI001C0E8AC3